MMVAGRATTCSPAVRVRPRKRGTRQAPALRPRNAADTDPPLWLRPVPLPDPMGTNGTGNCIGRGSGAGTGVNGSCVAVDEDVVATALGLSTPKSEEGVESTGDPSRLEPGAVLVPDGPIGAGP
jgi:hypothetical protein